MKVVVQRVRETSLSVDGELVSSIPFGLAVYFGVKEGDTLAQAEAIAKKVAGLRIFEDENGKMNLSVKEVGGEILLISQFTLYGDAKKGFRPSFSDAARPEQAKPLYEAEAELLRAYGIPVKTGIFGADMKILQMNDGPVTILYEV
ncbi:MAG: D-tyrosyl-tRNA(Tyr) deacylase [Clostridia bacterium]|nr:D-tyrosyl-tRNA(Tyr) deacylase [Clostridia bacterium]